MAAGVVLLGTLTLTKSLKQLREQYGGRPMTDRQLAALQQTAPREPVLVTHTRGSLITAAAELAHVAACLATYPGGRITSISLLKRN